MAYRWDPWRGCHRYSEGCLHCYIHKGDARRGVDTNLVRQTEKFDAPLARKKDGTYRMAAGLVWVCFSSDFLVEDADPWRAACFAMMRQRPELHFLFLTKRILRLADCLPADWGDGYDNVTIGCTVENQAACDSRLPVFCSLPIRHRNIICQPLLEQVDISPYLRDVELVVAGGESDREGRLFDVDWAVSLRDQCRQAGVPFSLRQLGSNTVRDGALIRLNPFRLSSAARELGLSCGDDSEQEDAP